MLGGEGEGAPVYRRAAVAPRALSWPRGLADTGEGALEGGEEEEEEGPTVAGAPPSSRSVSLDSVSSRRGAL